jgi:lipid II:glycine glycyltransferase (peptidoglycan interpeptide bridge formation enzyme)
MFIVYGDRVRLTHSITRMSSAKTSAARSQLGRANRLHHWEDMRFFRSSGMAFYDLGGWSGADPRLRSIDKFKESFGGEVVTTYNAIIPATLKGRLIATIFRLQP